MVAFQYSKKELENFLSRTLVSKDAFNRNFKLIRLMNVVGLVGEGARKPNEDCIHCWELL